ncbi:NDMA-dependent alcohol dehydrogenase [Tsukamurella sp. 8F]|uniref:NDMA-dependent alcohol dehydrogenase n=1 Tax=unclassified Tsukamurella TaxID=2633480 RepID=UPI0023B90485|nr:MULTISPECIES: NDMA-dependent alcohol dehydrogenase [unclassified Tsukamurella]MDF0528994.1 NDMA-dependent alcohol dehydrogenase [Tsukamurella sp. 8J]MDF0587367.1 NDMA-dependent alcohol dehydrogenase [Tsukamurella sp. 8F]
MKTQAAAIFEPGQDWQIEELELDAPKWGEVQVELAASGMCHSDEHVRDGSVIVGMYPYIGGHEGAGVVTAIGPGVTTLEVGDHVALGFIPACGRCRACATGMSSICDLGANLLVGAQILDGTARHHIRGEDAGLMCLLGTFAPHTVVNEASCVKLTNDIPLDKAALVGCGVTTGWGSSVYAAGVSAGETVVVLGMGGVGCGAVQGAHLAGARHVVLVDPSPFKREQGKVFGATHTVATIEEALPLLEELTWGHLADKVLITVDVARGDLVAPAMSLVAKGGVCVQVSVGKPDDIDVQMSLFDLTAMRKTFKGSWFGNANIRFDIPHLLRLYMEGQLKLDEMITREYTLDQVNDGYAAMRRAENVRGLIRY